MYTQQRYVLMTLDPVHIGTGGYRLGRVDNSIVREPGTNLPKIPGTSLSGAVRQYAARRYAKPQCAGQGQGSKDRKPHCGQSTCPICYTFGSIRGAEGGNAGTVNIGDARLLLFPVYSLAGPVWVTSPATLSDFGIEQRVTGDQARWNDNVTDQKRLNLGWLMVEKEGDLTLSALPPEIPQQVRERVVLISDKLFSQVVNSNLEVRTSVSIDPLTGAAQEGALFTYEALPRATFLWMEVVQDDYREAFPKTEKQCQMEEREENGEQREVYTDNAGDPLGETWEGPLDVVAAGLAWAEYLGIGGMGTRGFGRIKLVSPEEVNHG
ncbi:MAG: type III-B CRISPR module RAMP protein Cmr4 [Chloroflexota bacterium]|nr:type III-B CRISPR module RAMP protein Cmr4 [Chloroflexota bacterium]